MFTNPAKAIPACQVIHEQSPGISANCPINRRVLGGNNNYRDEMGTVKAGNVFTSL